MKADSIIDAVRSVTKRWCKQRKAEERQASKEMRRRDAMTRASDTYSLKDAAYDCMEEAYLKASGDGQYPAMARQIMYAARGPIQEATGEHLDDKYFTQTLLPGYLLDHPDSTVDWDIAFDARGHLHEPHTGTVVPLGTREVREHLERVDRTAELEPASRHAPLNSLAATCGPQHRYSAILFCEKEGFGDLFWKIRLPERRDLAVMSTKGMSVVASRLLVDRLCGEHDIPLLVLHDFDKAGFSILGSLQRSTARYQFQNTIRVVDLGLRLTDVDKYELQSEAVRLSGSRSKLRANLRRNGATEEEIEFLESGQRVELNAMTSRQLVDWLENKLDGLGIAKVVPDDATVTLAYRHSLEAALMNQAIQSIRPHIIEQAKQAAMPPKLVRQVRQTLKTNPARSWDAVVAEIAKNKAQVLATNGAN